ncbi:HEAT repeat domain-containing protein [Streptomyces californicus]|uniref:HEAT repeat domain-containing protein n=1 Tax=Streptomyces californicus TaxID=67351 RepID=UPI0036858D21
MDAELSARFVPTRGSTRTFPGGSPSPGSCCARTAPPTTRAGCGSRRPCAVPELLPDVAEFVDGPDESNRSFALRVLAMCGTVARPWADRAAAHLSEDDEPYEPARRHAVWMLSQAGDERCVEPLIDGLSSGRATGFSVSPPYLSTCDWEKSDLNYTEALARSPCGRKRSPSRRRRGATFRPQPFETAVPPPRRTPRKGPESGGGRAATRTKSCTR